MTEVQPLQRRHHPHGCGLDRMDGGHTYVQFSRNGTQTMGLWWMINIDKLLWGEELVIY